MCASLDAKGKQVGQRVGAAALLVLAAIGADRLTHLPSSAAILEDRKWLVPVGHHVEFAGLASAQLITIESGAGDGAQVRAGPALIEGADDKAVKSLVWQVSRLDDPNGDNKVRIDIALDAPSTDNAVISIRRTGTKTRPELQIGSPNASLLIQAGVMFGDARTFPHATLTADGVTRERLRTAFKVAPGGNLQLTFPAYSDGTPKGMTLTLGEDEPIGPRLWLRLVGIVADGDTSAWKAACAATSGRQLWPMLVRAKEQFDESDCASGRVLAATDLDVGSDGEAITLSLAGSAFTINRDQPITSRWFNWIKNNPVLGFVMSAALSTSIAWLLKAIWGGKKEGIAAQH